MKSKHLHNILIFIRAVILLLCAFISIEVNAQNGGIKPDPSHDRYGDPISNQSSKSPLQLNQPSNITMDVVPDTNLRNVTIYEKIGDSIDYRPPTTMTIQEFADYQNKRMAEAYWSKVSNPDTTAEQPGLFKLKIPGLPNVDIVPTGTVSLALGGRYQKTDNPNIPVRSRSTTTLDMDPAIQLGLNGTVGERLKVSMNWDTKATFDFDNNIKISYTGKEIDILRDVQAGTISMPLNNSLIRGAQNLFGIKATLQFGRLAVTALFSQQKGKTESITIKGGAQSRQFEIQGSDYDEYRHFFLGHYFRDVYEKAFLNNPTSPNNGFKVTRVEVYITNSRTQTEGLRNIVAFTDLGEASPQKQSLKGSNSPYARNDANTLFSSLLSNNSFRDPDETVNALEAAPFGMKLSSDFERINSARKLDPARDYTFHEDLGYLSLTSKLQDDEALAIAYEYTVNGQVFKVGELVEDYANIKGDSLIVLKLLKPQSVKTDIGTWDLMMKNIYSLNTSGIIQDNFQLRVIYKDDRTGVDNPTLQEGIELKNKPLVKVFGLDKINKNGDFIADGNFDFIDGYTIDTKKGRIIFPVLEPFSSGLMDPENNTENNKLGFHQSELAMINKYVYKELYTKPLSVANQITAKDKFFITGQYQSANSAEIRLPGIKIAENSVQIQVGSNTLTEGMDFTVNYNTGTVKITNTGVLASGNNIVITYEQADVMSFKTKSLMGTRFDYTLNKDVVLGGTFLYYNEPPVYTRVALGNEPTKNAQVGLDAKYKAESRLITKAVDFLPVIQTKEKSNVAVQWEGAALIPSYSRGIGEKGVGFLDDFEGAERPIQLTTTTSNWRLGSTPKYLGDENVVYPDWNEDSTQFTDHRAKLNWYKIDQTYYQAGISDVGFDKVSDDEITEYAFTRSVAPTELFPQKTNTNFTNNFQQIFDIAYYPKERGPYNYNVKTGEVQSNGLFRNPEKNWAAITTAINNRTDFNETNIEFIDFWMMDPFTRDAGGQLDIEKVLPQGYLNPGVDGFTEADRFNEASFERGGMLYFHLGDVSEDVVKDGRHGFENGLPDNVTTTKWGKVTTMQFINPGFDNSQPRKAQDVGMDGIGAEEESTFFSPVLDQVRNSGNFNLDAKPVSDFVNDVSSDNFVFHNLGDDDERPLFSRYRDYNGMENNTPENSGSSITRSSNNRPDNEDLNDDKTLNINEDFLQYAMPINKNDLRVGGNEYVVAQQDDEKGNRWYQIRIPIRKNVPQEKFQTVKFMRMVLTDFQQPIILRTTEMQLVGSQWRRLGKAIEAQQGDEVREASSSLTISTVNVEENSGGVANQKSPYTIPPGFIRDLDRASGQVNALRNESSLQLCVDSIEDGLTEYVYKNITFDVLSYNRLRMFIHGETPTSSNTQNGELMAFIRLGTERSDNYYEVELPLILSDINSFNDEEIWKEENRIDISLDELTQTKTERNANNGGYTSLYSRQSGKYTIKVKGNPDLSTLRTMVLGVRNPVGGGVEKACVWFDELRVTDYKNEAGYATRASVSTNLADLGTVTATGQYTTFGYGDIQQNISDRARENTLQYGVSSNLNLHKFIPGKTPIVNLPLYVSYDKQKVSPKYNPLDPDVELDKSLESIDDPQERESLAEKVVYDKTIRSINLTNVKKNKIKANAKKHIYDIENVTLSAGYTEEKRSGISGGNVGLGNNLHSYMAQTYNGNANYTYSLKPLSLAPFDKAKWAKNQHLKLIKDINLTPYPTSIRVNGALNRSYIRTQLYNDQLTIDGVTPTYEKRFTFDRTYGLTWPITKSINLSYNSLANTLIDEPDGNRHGDETITKEEYKRVVNNNLMAMGRLKNYTQSLNGTYRLPIDKIPLFSFVNSDVGYKTDYTWQAGALGLVDANGEALGNKISNSRDLTGSGKLNFEKLYNKSKYLKSINSPSRQRPKRSTTPKEDEEEEKEKFKLKEAKPVKSTVNLLMMVKSVDARYTLTHGTNVPGFMPTPEYLGSSFSENYAPGLPFLLGDQNLDVFQRDATNNNWLTKSTLQNDQFVQTRSERITIKANVEPFNSLKIKLDAQKTVNSAYNEKYIYNDSLQKYISENAYISGGSVDLSYITLMTAFASDDSKNNSQAFEDFENNRTVVMNRLADEKGVSANDYGLLHQDVLLPAFLAAYTGSDVNEVNVNRVPKLPLPNWRIDYSGLTKNKFLKKKFSSISISHAYSSQLKVPTYTSSLEYKSNDLSGNLNYFDEPELEYLVDSAGNRTLIPNYMVTEIGFVERFSPLFGVNVRTKKQWQFRVDYNKSRSVTLSSNQVNEKRSEDVTVSIGYSKKGMAIPGTKRFTKTGQKYVLKNNVDFKADISIKDSKEIQRIIDGNQIVTGGNLAIQIRPNVSYDYSKLLNIQLYYEHTINKPKVSTSFDRTTIAFGIRLRFKLA